MSTLPQNQRQRGPYQPQSYYHTSVYNLPSVVSGSSVASSSQQGSPILSPKTAIATMNSSIQASPEPIQGRDDDQVPSNFQLPEPLVSRKTSSNSIGPTLMANANATSDTTTTNTAPKTSLMRRMSSRASRITSRRQSSAAPNGRDTSVGPCLLRRRSESNATAPPEFPPTALDFESDIENDDLHSLRSVSVQDGGVRGSSANSTTGSVNGSSNTMAGPVIPPELQRGTWVKKVSKKGRSKKVCLVYDPDSTRLTWDKKRPNKFLHLDDVLAVRSGSDVQQYSIDLNMPGIVTLFTIIYAKKSENKIMHLVAETAATCNVWTTFLDAMLRHRVEVMTSLMSFDDKAIAQYWQNEMTRAFGDQPRSEAQEELDMAGVKRVCQKLHIYSSSSILEVNFRHADLRRRERLNFVEFLEFVHRMNQRPDIRRIMYSIARQPHLGITLEEFLHFMHNVQGEDVDTNRLAWEKKFVRLIRKPRTDAMDKPDSDRPEKQLMSEAAFVGFLTSKQNGPLIEEPSCYTLDRPLNEYFISSSHNTYLLGRQVAGVSSVEGYIAALSQGCRCIEVDCWDGPDGQPLVLHGRTLTSAITFRETIATINKHAFIKSLLPLIISIENHCNPTQQQIMFDIMGEIFGSRLVYDPVDPLLEKLPAPSQLMERICIKVKTPSEPHSTEPIGRVRGKSLSSGSPLTRPTIPENTAQSLPQSPLLTPSHSSKRLASKARVNTITEGEVSDLLYTSTSDNESGSDTGAPAISPNKTVKVLGQLGVYFAGVKFSGFDSPSAKKFNHIFSFMESTFSKHSRTKEDKMVLDLHNMRYMMRVYPDYQRVSSSNFDPLIYWRRGVQMAALNWQTNDLGMQVNRAMFEGGTDSSGYVLKPKALRDIQVLPFNLEIAEGKKERSVVSFKIDVLSAQQLMRPANLSANKAMNPYVEVEVFDGRASEPKTSNADMGDLPLKYQTEVIRENGFNPMFHEGEFNFRLTTKYPEFVFVKFTVKLSPNGESYNHRDQQGVASWTVKLVNLKEGYRTLPLENDEGVQYLFSTLFCKIKVDPIRKTLVDSPQRGRERNKFKSLGGKMFGRMNTSPRGTMDKAAVEKASQEKNSFDS